MHRRAQTHSSLDLTADVDIVDHVLLSSEKSTIAHEQDQRLSPLPTLELDASLDLSNESNGTSDDQLRSTVNDYGLRIVTPCVSSNLAVDESYEM
jgi:hypothetical protein